VILAHRASRETLDLVAILVMQALVVIQVTPDHKDSKGIPDLVAILEM
jgi:hypothetical protein